MSPWGWRCWCSWGRLVDWHDTPRYFAVSPDGSKIIQLPDEIGEGLVFGEWLPLNSQAVEPGAPLVIDIQPTSTPSADSAINPFLGEWVRDTPIWSMRKWPSTVGQININADDEVAFIAIGQGCIEIDCHTQMNYRLNLGKIMPNSIHILDAQNSYNRIFDLELVEEDHLQLTTQINYRDASIQDTEEVVNFSRREPED